MGGRGVRGGVGEWGAEGNGGVDTEKGESGVGWAGGCIDWGAGGVEKGYQTERGQRGRGEEIAIKMSG